MIPANGNDTTGGSGQPHFDRSNQIIYCRKPQSKAGGNTDEKIKSTALEKINAEISEL
jgi:hypothetical protein